MCISNRCLARLRRIKQHWNDFSGRIRASRFKDCQILKLITTNVFCCLWQGLCRCIDSLFIFSSCRVSIFLSREVLLECHIAVVSFDIMKCSSRSRLFYLRYRASYFNKFFMFWHVVVVAAVIFLLFLLRLLFLVLLPQCSWIVTDTCLAVQILIAFLSYLQDILSFSCSPSTNLTGSSVDFFVIGFQLSLLGVEMAVPCGKQMLLDIY